MKMTGESAQAVRAYVQCVSKRAKSREKDINGTRRPFVTISRQVGAGGITVGEKLVKYLNDRDESARCPWTVFDKNLVQTVIEEHKLPEITANYMVEDKIPEYEDILEELFGLHPAQWTLVRKTSETILRLALSGDAILVGRGAHIITQKLPDGFHARLIGSFGKRLKHLQDYYLLPKKKAEEMIRKEDKGRKNYLKKYFGRDIDDPLMYHAVINTDLLSYEQAARLIGDSVLARIETV